jgi:hypothetical protein
MFGEEMSGMAAEKELRTFAQTWDKVWCWRCCWPRSTTRRKGIGVGYSLVSSSAVLALL